MGRAGVDTGGTVEVAKKGGSMEGIGVDTTWAHEGIFLGGGGVRGGGLARDARLALALRVPAAGEPESATLAARLAGRGRGNRKGIPLLHDPRPTPRLPRQRPGPWRDPRLRRRRPGWHWALPKMNRGRGGHRWSQLCLMRRRLPPPLPVRVSAR